MTADEEFRDSMRSMDRARALGETIEGCDALVDAERSDLRGLDVRAMPDVDVTKRAALLGQLATTTLGFRQQLAAVELQIALKETTDTITHAASALESTDKSTERLADWTRGLVYATWVLGGATILAAVVGAVATWRLTAMSEAEHAPTPLVIVIPSPPRP